MEEYPHLRGDGLPPSFKGPPQFRTVNVVTLEDDNVLRCSCGLSDRYGIPCRHLFALEDSYDIRDIDHRYQSSYAYYAWHPNHAKVTQAFKRRSLLEYRGIRHKTLEIHTLLPFLSLDSPFSIEDILRLFHSPIPVCWNYSVHEYPGSYTNDCTGSAGGDFTQEEMIQDYDSDGAPVHQATSNSDQLNDDGSTCRPVLAGTIPLINDGQLLSKFKAVMNCHKSQISKKKLWEILINAKHSQKIEILREQPSLLGGSQEEFVSLHLALDTSSESVQYAYGHSRNKKKRKNRQR
jgi:hypothetical protein